MTVDQSKPKEFKMHEDTSKHTVGQTTSTPNHLLLYCHRFPTYTRSACTGLLRVCVLHYRIHKVPTTNLTGQEPTNFNLLVV